MRSVCLAVVAATSILTPSVMLGAMELMSANVTAGQNLEALASIKLSTAAPSGGLLITLTSNDPSMLLLSMRPDRAGSRTIDIKVPEGLSVSTEFFVQALGNSGTVTYTASAPGYESSTGTVTLGRSAILIASPFGFGKPLPTTAGTLTSRIRVSSALLDSTGNPASEQLVRGGLSVMVDVTSSSAAVGTMAASPLTIDGGSSNAATEFQPVSPGETTLAVNVPPGFSTPAKFAMVTVEVRPPGMAITTEVTIGQNLELPGTLVLGRPAPLGGVAVTLASSDPSLLLLSTGLTSPGSKSITITIPAGGRSTSYCLQALGNSGTATYTVNATGYLGRTGKVTLTPSGVFLGVFGPPDEAEYFRQESADVPHGFVVKLSGRRSMPVTAYTTQLDPIHHRGADVTLQPLRAGLSLQVTLKNSNPTIGTIASTVTIPGGSGEALAGEFTALEAGSTIISVVTPEGFTTAGNSTSFKAVVLP
jgi:hypothetical protein